MGSSSCYNEPSVDGQQLLAHHISSMQSEWNHLELAHSVVQSKHGSRLSWSL
jgi:hypothetical protein